MLQLFHNFWFHHDSYCLVDDYVMTMVFILPVCCKSTVSGHPRPHERHQEDSSLSFEGMRDMLCSENLLAS